MAHKEGSDEVHGASTDSSEIYEASSSDEGGWSTYETSGNAY